MLQDVLNDKKNALQIIVMAEAFYRYNFKDATTVQNTPIVAPFDIPSNIKRTYILIGIATNV